MSGYVPSIVVVFGLALAIGLMRLASGRSGIGIDLPLFALLGAAAVVLHAVLATDEAPLALVGGILAASAALYGLWFNAAVAREAAERLRSERKADTRRAVRAEIDTERQNYIGYDWDGAIASASAAFDRDPSFVPMVVPRKRDLYLGAVVDRIELLDDRQVETAVRYYALAADIELLKQQMVNPAFAQISASRRRALLLDLIKYEERLVVVACSALEELADSDRDRRDLSAAFESARDEYLRRYPARPLPAFSGPDRTDQGLSGLEPQA